MPRCSDNGLVGYEKGGGMLDSGNYLPQGFCYLWNRQLLTLHMVSDSIICLSYLSIAMSLAWLMYREQRQIPFAGVYLLFGTVIVACGFSHAMDVIVLWNPWYGWAGYTKLITAIASLATAMVFPFLVPRIGDLLHAAKSSRRNERRFLAAADSSHDAFFYP